MSLAPFYAQLFIGVVGLLVSSGLLTSGVDAEERTYPIKIGVLTWAWGPTPHTVGLRDGLLELGYKENEQFVIGVRFTQEPVNLGPVSTAVFNDTCGNLIQIAQLH